MSSEASASSGSAGTSEQIPAAVRPAPHWFPPLRTWCVASGIAATSLPVQWWDLLGSQQSDNIYTWIACFAGLLTPCIWFATLSRQPWPRGLTPLAMVAVSLGLFFLFFRVQTISGTLMPTFAYRFSKQPDQLLEIPELPPAADAADAGIPLGETHPWDFPQFLGPTRSAATEAATLVPDWQAHPPELVWRQPIGAGWGAFSAVNGFAVTMEQRDQAEMITCYEIATGKLVWQHSITARYETVIAGIGPRSTPTIDEGRVYALGGTGVLRCLEGATGRLLWQHDLVREFQQDPAVELAEVLYGRSNSPLVVDQLVVVPAGGKADAEGKRVSLVAYDKVTGEEVWRGGEEQIGYASPSVGTIAGVRQILIVNESSLAGHDPETGRELWQHPWPGHSATQANASQAVPIAPDLVFVSKEYGGGSLLLRLSPTPESNDWQASVVLEDRKLMKTKFANVVLLDGYVSGLSDGLLECFELNTFQRQWKTRAGDYGHGQVLRVGRHLLIQCEWGDVALVELSPERHKELARFHAIDGKTWNNLCLWGPYLLCRNAEEAACWKLPIAEVETSP